MGESTWPRDSDASASAPLIFLTGASVGLVAPLIMMGRTTLGIAAGLALLLSVISFGFGPLLRHIRESVPRLLVILLAVVFVAWLPNIPTSPTPAYSLVTMTRCFGLVIGVIMIWAAMCLNRDVLDIALKALLISAAIFSLVAVLSLSAIPELFAWTRLNGWQVIDPARGYKESASAFCIMGPAVIWAAFRLGGSWRYLAALVIALFVTIVIDSYSRASIAGILASVLVATTAWSMTVRNSRHVLVLIVALLVLIAAPMIWIYTIESVAPQNVSGKDTWFPTWLIDWHRQQIWAFAIGQGHDARWLGTGINAVNLLPGSTDVIPGKSGARYLAFHPHNWAIEILVETGIVGFAGLLAMIAAASWMMARQWVATRSFAMLAALAVAAGYWGSGLFNFSYWSAWWQLSFYVVTAICLAGYHHDRKEH